MRHNLNLILAQNRLGYIGKKNTIPWKSKTDMSFFKKMTLGDTVLMGQNTYLSFNGRPLPERNNIVIKTREDQTVVEGFTLITMEDLLYGEKLDEYLSKSTVWVIGGTATYKKFLSLDKNKVVSIDSIYLNVVDDITEGDVKAPDFDYYDFAEYDSTIVLEPVGEETMEVVSKRLRKKIF